MLQRTMLESPAMPLSSCKTHTPFAIYDRVVRATPLLSLFACALLVSCEARNNKLNGAADAAAAVRALDEQWSAAAAKNDLDSTVAFYADDAVLLPPNAPIVQGRKAIRDMWAGLISPGVSLSWKATKVEAADSGELAYLYGTYADSAPDAKGGPPVHDTGKILEIWKKQADGNWKCIVDTYNSDVPLPAAESKK
jgi:uncharacterized protein (TIGR02246 family)